MLAPGDTVRGYTVSALLGEGGMGAVFAAVRESDGLPVAIKVLHDTRGEHLQRARVEAGAQQLLDHPNVVKIHEVLDLQGGPGLVMEQVLGPDLRAWLAAGRPSLADALQVYRGILAGVEHAHQLGLVHRDLKPSNVLLAVTPEGVIPKVADFGLAKVDGAPQATRTGVMLGTPGYMAPEQVRDAKRSDRRADVYALGVLLYEMVCGQAPIAGHDVITAYEEMMSRSWVDPGSLGAPPAIAAAIRAALQPDASDRPADAEALRLSLDPGATFADGGPSFVILDSKTEGAARARSLVDRTVSGVMDPTRPALRTPIAPPEGGVLGREDLLAALSREVSEPGLVVLRGPPGVGKTAVARVLGRLQGGHASWVGGVWWVDLRDVDSVETAVARVLGVAEGGAVGHAMERRGRALMILDEGEQFAEEVAACAGSWVAEAPALTVLVTSRVGLDGARTVRCEPLSGSDGTALFIRRARQGRPEWVPTVEERGAIGRLVAKLDGLPLAVELAAARSRVLTPVQLLDRIERRLDLLRTRGSDPRSASLRGAIASSWELLDPVEQRALTWLSVAVGAIAPAAAEALLEPVDPDPLLVLEGLEEASWVSIRDAADGKRYAMLQSLRAFAREHGDLEPAQRAHARVWLERGQQALEGYIATGDPALADRLSEEVEDLVAVSARFPSQALGRDAAVVAAGWLGRRGDLARSVALARQATAWSETLGEGVEESRLVLAERLLSTRAEEAVALARPLLDDPDPIRWCRARIALSRALELSATELKSLDEVVERARELGQPILEAQARLASASAEFRMGRLVEAGTSGEEALALFRSAGHRPEEANALSLLGLIQFRLERWSEAEQALRAAADLAGSIGERRAQAASLGRLSMVLARSERREEAVGALQDALVLSRQIGDVVGEGYCLANLGALEPDHFLATQHFRAAAVLARRAGAWPLLTLAQRNIGSSEIQRGAPEEALQPLSDAADRLRSLGESTMNRVLCWKAIALAGCGRLDEARSELGALTLEGEDAQIGAVVGALLEVLEEGIEEGLDRVDGELGPREELGWDVWLTRNLAAAVLEQR